MLARKKAIRHNNKIPSFFSSVRPSVCPSVRPFVRPSIRPSVRSPCLAPSTRIRHRAFVFSSFAASAPLVLLMYTETEYLRPHLSYGFTGSCLSFSVAASVWAPAFLISPLCLILASLTLLLHSRSSLPANIFPLFVSFVFIFLFLSVLFLSDLLLSALFWIFCFRQLCFGFSVILVFVFSFPQMRDEPLPNLVKSALG